VPEIVFIIGRALFLIETIGSGGYIIKRAKHHAYKRTA
jgi:hypothetical protein